MYEDGISIFDIFSISRLLKDTFQVRLIEENTTDEIEGSLDHIFGDIKAKINELEQEVNNLTKKYKS